VAEQHLNVSTIQAAVGKAASAFVTQIVPMQVTVQPLVRLELEILAPDPGFRNVARRPTSVLR
jgi:hypothetical protein